MYIYLSFIDVEYGLASGNWGGTPLHTSQPYNILSVYVALRLVPEAHLLSSAIGTHSRVPLCARCHQTFESDPKISHLH